MSTPVIRAEEIEPYLLLVHRRFGEVMVLEQPASSRSLVRIRKLSNDAETYVKRQELSWS